MGRAYVDATVKRLFDSEPTFDWVGGYEVDGDRLVLGPFRGQPTEHTTIPMGEGVCGSVAVKGQTEVVPDVRKRPGHIACSLSTRSEMVAPIVRDGQVVACHWFFTGSNSSASVVASPSLLLPPVISTLPFGISVAACWVRSGRPAPADAHVSRTGS